MEYAVSEKIRGALGALTGCEKTKKALRFMEEDNEYIIQRQIEMTLIPSPTFHEEKKAARVLELFKEYGLEDCHIDDYGNAVGIMSPIDPDRRSAPT